MLTSMSWYIHMFWTVFLLHTNNSCAQEGAMEVSGYASPPMHTCCNTHGLWLRRNGCEPSEMAWHAGQVVAQHICDH